MLARNLGRSVHGRRCVPYVGVRTFLSLPFVPQTHKVSRVINAPVSDVYEVVSNVNKYNQFVPFVQESFIKKRDANGEPTNGGLRVGWKQFDEVFECDLVCVPGKKVAANSVTISLFEYLLSEWAFRPLKRGKQEVCVVDFSLEYKFKNPLYNTVSGMFQDQVTLVMIGAFQRRVAEVQHQRSRANVEGKAEGEV